MFEDSSIQSLHERIDNQGMPCAALYVACSKTGLVKAGVTCYPRERGVAMKREFERLGDEMDKFQSTGRFFGYGYPYEGQLLRSIREAGGVAEIGREWFRGIDFEKALCLAETIHSEALEQHIRCLDLHARKFGLEVRKIP